MKVLTVTNIFPSIGNPFSGTYVAEQVRSLDKLVSNEVVSKTTKSAIGLVPFFAKAALRSLMSEFDLIHAHYGFHSAIVPALVSRKPLIITFHGSDALVEPGRNRLYGFMQRFVVSRAAHLIAVSDQVRQTLIDVLGAPPDRVSVIPCGVDVTLFRPQPKSAARERLGVEPHAKMALFIGRLSQEKGVDLIRETSHFLPDVTFYFIGAGQIQWTAHNAKFLGALRHSEVPEWINASDILLLPSLSEGTPVSVLEALASGVPVVCTDVGACPDLVNNERTGLLIPRGNADALRAAIERALGQHFYTDEGRQLVVEKYSLDEISKRLFALYEKVLATGKNPGLRVDKGIQV